MLGVPKNTIAPRLKENTNFVTRTIDTLQKDFLNLIFKKLNLKLLLIQLHTYFLDLAL